MNKLEIYEYQLKTIENALRLASNTLNCKSRETCLDREVTQAWQMVKNALNGDIDTYVNRMTGENEI